MHDQLETRLQALVDPVDDADWADVRRRAGLRAPHPAGRVGRVGRRRVLRLAAACAAAIAAITGAAQLVAREDDAPRLPGLEAVAAIAAAAPSTVPGAHEYAYTKLRYGALGTPPDCTEEWWIARDGSGRLQQEGPNCPTGTRDRRFGPRDALREYIGMHGNAFHGDPAALPTDPEQLERALDETLRGLADVTPELLADPERRSDGMLDVIEQVLANPFAPPAVRAALYRVADDLPDVHVVEGATDPEGRTGSALTVERDLNGDRELRELIFDPATSRTLARRETRFSRDGRRRIVLGLTYLAQGTVGSPDARP